MREEYTDAQIADFLRKSYFVVDGLWFVKTEEKRGFDEAMEQDEAVWDVMSKIQARKAKAVLGLHGDSLGDLAKAFQLKLAAEGYDFDVDIKESAVDLTVHMCPWYEALKSSDRTHIAETIANRICVREFRGWVNEFTPGIDFTINSRLCVESDGCQTCKMSFRRVEG